MYLIAFEFQSEFRFYNYFNYCNVMMPHIEMLVFTSLGASFLQQENLAAWSSYLHIYIITYVYTDK